MLNYITDNNQLFINYFKALLTIITHYNNFLHSRNYKSNQIIEIYLIANSNVIFANHNNK